MTLKSRCHVVGCTRAAADIQWVPQYRCCLNFCSEHNPPTEDTMIDLARAKADHKASVQEFDKKAKSL